MSVVAHGGRGRKPHRAALRQKIDAVRFHRDAERELLVSKLWEELSERAGYDDGSREAVLAQCFRFFQHPDLELAQLAALLRIPAHQASELDGGRQPGRSASNNDDVHRHRLVGGDVAEKEAVARKWRLVILGDEGSRRGFGHLLSSNAL